MSVEQILGLIAKDMTVAAIVRSYPALTAADVRGAVAYAQAGVSVTVDCSPQADVLAMVDGEIYDVPNGRLDLRGFDPGPHRILVNLRDRDDGGREIQFTLRPGETFQRTVTLTK